jgi:hypothetical protein
MPMTDRSRTSTEDEPGGAERLIKAIGDAASDVSAREALAELGDRARGIVELLARSAKARAAGASSASRAGSSRAAAGAAATEEARARHSRERFADDPVPPNLHRRLDELRACVGEVADVLEATVERLGTIEDQLGDPEEAVERQLADGIERCERVLMGIEHRVFGPAASLPEPDANVAAAPPPLDVLVVSPSSATRARLCLALEKQGLRAHAATGSAMAVRLAGRVAPGAALLAPAGGGEDAIALLEEWKEAGDRGILPPAAVLVAGNEGHGPGGAARSLGFSTVKEEHGSAAMAAWLASLARGGNEGAGDAG